MVARVVMNIVCQVQGYYDSERADSRNARLKNRIQHKLALLLISSCAISCSFRIHRYIRKHPSGRTAAGPEFIFILLQFYDIHFKQPVPGEYHIKFRTCRYIIINC